MWRRLFGGLLLIAVLLASWAWWWEPDSLVVREVEIGPAHWPTALDGLRVAQLSDLHAGSPWIDSAKLAEIVRLTNAARPDLIVLSGDYISHETLGGRTLAIEAVAPLLAGLRAPLGVYAVLGNHDLHGYGDPARNSLEAAGIKVLRDRALPVQRHGARFWLLGVEDYVATPHRYQPALAAVPESEPLIVLTHNPDLFPELPARVSLMLAGHTHGGQVRVPLLGTPVTNSVYGQRYAAGTVVESDKTLFVSSGIGTSILPVRFGVPPEISLLTLRASVPAGPAP